MCKFKRKLITQARPHPFWGGGGRRYCSLVNIMKSRGENMRFLALSLSSALSIIVVATDASATPMFSRQTGMACSSCHFQHFPMLNGFGRAFKSAGYTMMGGQPKVEAEDLSIPGTLNMAVVTTAGYEKSNQALGTYPEKTTGDGVFYVPASGGELSLFFGGRVSENAGFLGELAVGGAVAGAHSSAKTHIDASSLLDFMPDGMRTGVVPFATDALGASYGFELLNTGANAVQQLSGAPGLNGAHSGAFSAQQYIGTNGPAKGVALVLSHPMGFINLTKFDRTGITNGGMANLGSTYLRVARTLQLGGWDAAIGAQMWSGNSAVAAPATVGGLITAETKASAIDAQLQGNMGDLPVGFYASFASAPVVSSGNAYNTYNTQDPTGLLPVVANGISTKSSLNVSTEVGVLPDKATLGAAIRFGKNGDGNTDNAIMLIGAYKIARNMMASLSFTSASGSYWYSNTANTGTTDQIGNTTYTINLFTAF